MKNDSFWLPRFWSGFAGNKNPVPMTYHILGFFLGYWKFLITEKMILIAMNIA